MAFAALVVLSFVADIISVLSLAISRRADGWRVLGISCLVGALATAILALTIRNPDGTIFTRNPQIAQQNQRRIKRWTGGAGFAILLSLGLVLGASQGMVLVVLVGAFSGFAAVLFAMTIYAHLAIIRPRVDAGSQ